MSQTRGKMAKHTIQYGKTTLPFELTFVAKKRLSIAVHPDLRVVVRAPADKSLEKILAVVKRRAAWITKQRRHFEQFHPIRPARRYVSGETHYYLGRQYRLKVVTSNREDAKLRGRYIHVFTKNRDNHEQVEALLREWYRGHARPLFMRKLDLCYERIRNQGVHYPDIRLRKMTKRWGSCTKRGEILLNTELVKTPLYCIEYVIMHELVHLKVRNHTKEFYRFLTRCMPDWERRKQRLDLFIP
ncbi:MAG: M48 family metallopeptidase [Planctomycetes bacterium]|nr:M48 family metallopeptidase [Planctomycetota bacterium]